MWAKELIEDDLGIAPIPPIVIGLPMRFCGALFDMLVSLIAIRWSSVLLGKYPLTCSGRERLIEHAYREKNTVDSTQTKPTLVFSDGATA